MSSIVSRRPSFRNQSNDAFWMSIRFGSSRTCLTREKDVRARGAATLAVKRYSLPYNGERIRNLGQAKTAERQRDLQGYRKQGPQRKRRPAGPALLVVMVAGNAANGKLERGGEACQSGGRPPREAAFRNRMCRLLLDLDRGAGFLELRLDRVGLVLRHALLDGVGRAVDEVFRLLEAQARDRPDDLDDLDLLVTGAREHDVERRLLLRRGG